MPEILLFIAYPCSKVALVIYISPIQLCPKSEIYTIACLFWSSSTWKQLPLSLAAL